MELIWERIKIQTPYTLTKLLAFRMRIAPNEHASMELRAYADPAAAFSELERDASDAEIKVTVADETGAEEKLPLFAGIIDNIEVTESGGIYEMKLTAVSATRKLDERRRSRSYQDIEKTYADVIDETLSLTENAGALYYFKEDRPIGLPIIQYQETDWTFIRRMASHFALSAYPKTVSKNPILFIGLPKTGAEAIFSEAAYRVGVSEAFMKMGGDFSPYTRGYFLSVCVEDRENYQIGDETTYKNTKLYIVEKEAALVRGELRFRYLLGRKTLANQRMKFNRHFSGLSIGGTVIATARETVRLHLDIDGDRDAPAYPYHWTPPSGNLMYLMPKVGTRASLCFSGRDERSGKATNSPRTGADKCRGMEDYSNRTLTTEHNKQMNLFPNIMSLVGIGNDASPLSAVIDDASGIIFQSHGILDIIAAGTIRIEAPKVTLSAPKEVKFMRTALAGPAAQIASRGTSGAQVNLPATRLRSATLTLYQLQERIDGKGKTAYLFGTEYKDFPPHNDVIDIGYASKPIILRAAQGVAALFKTVTGAIRKLPEFTAATAAAITSLEVGIHDPETSVKDALINAGKSFLVGFAIGATANNDAEALRLGAGVGFAMAGGELPPEVKEKLMATANMLKETGQLDQLKNNEYYTMSVNGMTLTVNKHGDVFTGISGSIDVTYGKDAPVTWTRGSVTFDGIEDHEIKRRDMQNALSGGGLNFTLHLGGAQFNYGICLFPEDNVDGSLKRGYTHETGLDSQIGIGVGAGASQHIGNIFEPPKDNKPNDENSEEGVFFG